jgi:gamma-glutamylcyclotransferase (GGCT)/AIG2-like uncharacterized protein YtfP
MEHTYLFVYGTLRKGFALLIPEKITSDVEWVGYSKVKGKLYDIGKYPGAVPDDSGELFIKGEIIKIKAPGKVFKYLDNYEGYNVEDVQASEYCRSKEWFSLEDGTIVEAWIYWYNFAVNGKKRIDENDYIKFLQKNQLA